MPEAIIEQDYVHARGEIVRHLLVRRITDRLVSEAIAACEE